MSQENVESRLERPVVSLLDLHISKVVLNSLDYLQEDESCRVAKVQECVHVQVSSFQKESLQHLLDLELCKSKGTMYQGWKKKKKQKKFTSIQSWSYF